MTTPSSDKKVVHYSALVYCNIGGSAMLLPVDHPGADVSNTKFVTTSQVMSYNPESGSIESLNTRYERLALPE